MDRWKNRRYQDESCTFIHIYVRTFRFCIAVIIILEPYHLSLFITRRSTEMTHARSINNHGSTNLIYPIFPSTRPTLPIPPHSHLEMTMYHRWNVITGPWTLPSSSFNPSASLRLAKFSLSSFSPYPRPPRLSVSRYSRLPQHRQWRVFPLCNG